MERHHKLEHDSDLTDGTELIDKACFYRQVRKCRKLYPVNIPVRVRWTKKVPEGCLGYTIIKYWEDSGLAASATIWICSDLQRAHAIDTLIHEWTHVVYDVEGLDRPENHDCSDHDHTGLFWQLFGEHYATWNRSPKVD